MDSTSVKVTWAPRKWINTRPGVIVQNDSGMEQYTGYGFTLGWNCLIESTPRKQGVFLDLPAGEQIEWLFKIAPTSYLALHKTAIAPSLTVSFLTRPNGYVPQVFVPAGNLGIGLRRSYMVWNANAATYYFTSTSHGLLKVAAGSVTQVAGATTLITVVQHLSRLVGISTVGGSTRIQYCVPGNWDDWTTTTNGAGSIDLLMNGENLVDIRVINNVLVILSQKSIYIGYPTGVTNPPYRIEQILSHSDVCMDSRTVVQYENSLYYKGATSVYRFNNFKQEDIGYPQLFSMYRSANVANILSAVISYNIRETDLNLAGERFKEDPHYCLIPSTAFQLTTQLPMFYNIREGLWQPIIGTQHIDAGSGLATNNGFFDLVVPEIAGSQLNAPFEAIHYLRDRVEWFSNGSNLTAYPICLLQSPEIQVGDPYRVYRLDRIMVKYALTTSDNTGPAFTYSMTVNCINRTNTEVTTGAMNVVLDTNFLTNRIRTAWINLADKNLIGQFYKIDFSFNQDPTYRLEIHEFELYFGDAGDFFGIAT